jgi:hypothetical protein
MAAPNPDPRKQYPLPPFDNQKELEWPGSDKEMSVGKRTDTKSRASLLTHPGVKGRR